MIQNCWLKDNCSGVDCNSEFCLKKFKLDKLFELSLLPNNYKKDIKLRVDADNGDLESFKYLKSLANAIDKFVESGDSLYIHSPISGNGKTSWAIKLLKAYLDKVWVRSELKCRALYIHVPRFLLALKDNINEKSEYVQFIKDNVYEADLVIFDEVGTKALTQYEFENILSIINARLDLGKSNIYTSNLTDTEMQQKMGDRLYSRIVNMSQDILIVGRDKRGLF